VGAHQLLNLFLFKDIDVINVTIVGGGLKMFNGKLA
jgi:hypothetical protein